MILANPLTYLLGNSVIHHPDSRHAWMLLPPLLPTSPVQMLYGAPHNAPNQAASTQGLYPLCLKLPIQIVQSFLQPAVANNIRIWILRYNSVRDVFRRTVATTRKRSMSMRCCVASDFPVQLLFLSAKLSHISQDCDSAARVPSGQRHQRGLHRTPGWHCSSHQ